MNSVLGPSLAKYIFASKRLYRFFKPIADRYADLSGYRKLGLRAEDLIMEENPVVQKAISRLSERERYDRVYRLRVAMNCSMLHNHLPKDQQLKIEDDTTYLSPLIQEIESENAERKLFDSGVIEKPR